MIVTLAKMWLSDVVTGRTFGWYTDNGREQSFSVRGEVRWYADGQQRSVSAPGMAGEWKFTLVLITTDDTVILKAWLANNVTLFARDYRGQSMYGTFFQADFAEDKAGSYNSVQNTYRAAITLQAVDVVEGV